MWSIAVIQIIRELSRTYKLRKFKLTIKRCQKKRTEHVIYEDEVEIGPLQLQLMLGPSWKEDIDIAINSIFCDCGTERKKMINYKSYITNLNDIILKGWCSSCITIAARYIETGERKGIEKIADKIRNINKL
ncbi:hypothetical protein DHD32_16175 [Arenibacter sp. TNZ]|nr:hypothetical protein [Arenibacter sp. TNZ]